MVGAGTRACAGMVRCGCSGVMHGCVGRGGAPGRRMVDRAERVVLVDRNGRRCGCLVGGTAASAESSRGALASSVISGDADGAADAGASIASAISSAVSAMRLKREGNMCSQGIPGVGWNDADGFPALVRTGKGLQRGAITSSLAARRIATAARSRPR